MTEREPGVEAEARARTKHYDDEEEQVLNIKIDLKGPREVMSWMNPFNVPRRLVGRLPSGAREHMANAQREQLLAVRSIVDSLLDNLIDRLERAEEKGERKATRVEVE
jgi:hypothetical protein